MKNMRFLVHILYGILFVSCGQASSIDTAPISLKCLPSSVSYKRVFVTRALYPALVADDFCNSSAQTANLGGKWVAWLSTEGPNPMDHKNAKDRLVDVGPWYDMSGKVAVQSLTSLIQKGPNQPIYLDQTGASILILNENDIVWTGTKVDGTIDIGATCQQDSTTSSWSTTSTNVKGRVGKAGQVGAAWTELGPGPVSCDSGAHLYCFEQDCPPQ